ncbi:unnamed protein product (macronuclear) [Paramecium tetraurelia]|uniref:Secreted protein n=1 Tax=Paramecium tetraurelia TaxID=5888 RepID=A0CQ04_PARTE|nr:uncharacterized protein GSPATT00038828001 [Paramecium tetraurelia]CAK72871.1 unnamed protein product [Paramecium tetraurelia]|eukprot:XP_001440268.1 hypothetical protein (macronuclear) [Paramecium tetraurelia strain d4-2]
MLKKLKRLSKIVTAIIKLSFVNMLWSNNCFYESLQQSCGIMNNQRVKQDVRLNIKNTISYAKPQHDIVLKIEQWLSFKLNSKTLIKILL